MTREEAQWAPSPRESLIEAEQLEQRRQIAHLLSRRRRGAADEVEDLTVLQSVIGKPADLTVLVEIDRDHPLIGNLVTHEGKRTRRALGDVIEHFTVEGCHRRGRAHDDQHLVLAGADWNLLERALGQDVTALELLAGDQTATQACAHRSEGCSRTGAAPTGSHTTQRGRA